MVDNARSFIYIAVMNYLPTMEFSHPRRYCRGSGRGATKSGKGVGDGVMGPRKQAGGAKPRGQMEGKPGGEAEETETGSGCSRQENGREKDENSGGGGRDGELEA